MGVSAFIEIDIIYFTFGYFFTNDTPHNTRSRKIISFRFYAAVLLYKISVIPGFFYSKLRMYLATSVLNTDLSGYLAADFGNSSSIIKDIFKELNLSVKVSA